MPDTTTTAALRLLLEYGEAEAAVKQRKALNALQARVGAGNAGRPLRDDDIVEICFKENVIPVRTLVRHLPDALREFCHWLWHPCARTTAGAFGSSIAAPWTPRYCSGTMK